MAGQGSYHGVTVTLIDSGARTIAPPSSSIIGLVDTYTSADGRCAEHPGAGDRQRRAKSSRPGLRHLQAHERNSLTAGAVVVAVGVTWLRPARS